MEADQIIIEFEEKYDPYQYLIDGFSVWPVLRFNLYEALRRKIDTYVARAPRRLVKRKIITHFLSRLPLEILKFFKLPKSAKRVIIVSFYQHLRDQAGDYHRNIYFDYFRELPGNAVYWYNDIKGNLLKNYPFDYIDGIIPLILFRYYGKMKFRKYKPIITKLHSMLSEYLNNRHPDIGLSVDVAGWYKLASYYLSSKFAFSMYLGRLKPRLVIIENCYGQEGFVAAAKANGIPIYELQHGVMYQAHLGYSYGHLARRHQRTMPLPDKILTFGRYSSDVLEGRGYWESGDLPPVGFPRLEYFKQVIKPAPKIRPNLEILISSQWTVVDKIIEFIKPVIDQRPEHIAISIKPHPLESKENSKKYLSLGNSVKVLNKDDNFYELVSGCNIHCSVYSTTLFESIALGIPTIILNISGYEAVSSLIEHGSAKFVSTPEEFLDLARKAWRDEDYYRRWKETVLNRRDYYFQPNPEQNLKELLDARL